MSRRPTLTGKATLLDLLGRDTGLSHADIGALLGYDYREEPVTPKGPADGAKRRPSLRHARGPATSPAFDPREQAYWYVADITPFEAPSPETGAAAVQPPEPAPPPAGDPAYRELPLLPWRRLWPFVLKRLSHRRETRQIDTACWVRALAEARPLNRIPRQRRATLAGRILLIQDGGEALMPFQYDFQRLVERLARLLGRNRVEVIHLPRHLASDRLFHRLRGHYLEPEDGVLILSDLGQYQPQDSRLACWRALGRLWRRQGVRPLVLTPCPGRYHQPALRNDFQLVVLDHRAHPGRRPPSAGRPDAARRQLLAMLSAAQWASPALLRWWRLQLLGDAADVGSEYEVWWSDETWREPGACGLEPVAVAVARRDFLDELDPSQRLGVARSVAAAHRALSPELIAEEDLIHHSLGCGDGAFGRAQLLAAACQPDPHGDAWLARLSSRQEAGFWERNPLAAEQCRQALQRLGSNLSPPGLDPRRGAASDAPRDYELWQRGQRLVVAPAGANREGPGCRLAGFRHARRDWRVLVTQGDDGKESLTPLDRPIALPDSGRIVLHADSGDIVLEALRQPDWAVGIGRDGEGLYLNLVPGAKSHLENESRRGGRSSYRKLREPMRQAPPWAARHGFDAHGRHADFVIDGITQRLRWIPPGRFRMGSPEEEAERLDNETLHQVTLTEGYWLADTACTQALWRAVMGDNPSDFKGDPQNPVENVSWDDVQQFIERLNQRIPGLAARLPSEAEWEYACRAGTETPFHFGETLGTDQANYNGNYPYGNGRKGEYREKTLPVKALGRNAWGLYQLHGNVWEWCQDWLGDYPQGPVQDPTGPQVGRLRVLRGGSWFDRARVLRAAQRRGRPPDDDYHGSFGFRLATGQSPPAGKELARTDGVERSRSETAEAGGLPEA